MYTRKGEAFKQPLSFSIFYMEKNMRYHYEKPDLYVSQYGEVYQLDHPLFNRCTLYKMGDKGLIVIQQRFNPKTKHTWWTEIDPWLTDSIYLNPGFKELFDDRAKPGTDGIYPIVTVRQIMWALKMKPIPKLKWETVFDRREI